MEAEGVIILQISEWLGIPTRSAYNIIIGTAHSVGFRTDVKLNRIAEELRNSIKMDIVE